MNPFIVDLLVNAVREQSWYRQHANTVNAGVALLGSVLAFVATLTIAQDARWAGALALAIQLVGVVAVRLTRNGVSISQAEQLSAAAVTPSPGLPDGVWSDLVVPPTARGRHSA